MQSDVQQWLLEIKALKQKIADLERERDTAYASEANWLQLYTVEAQQRRSEAKEAQQTIQMLKQQIQQQENISINLLDDPAAIEAIKMEVSKICSMEELREKLSEVWLERNYLAQLLKTEQANHAQTRKSLTAVIGDTLARLHKEKEQSSIN